MLKRLLHSLVLGHSWKLLHHAVADMQADYILCCYGCGMVKIISFEGVPDAALEELAVQ